MHKKQFLTVLAIVVLAAGGYCVYHQARVVEREEAIKNATEEPAAATYVWALTPIAEDASGMPHTKVALLVSGASHDIGTYLGSCNQVNAGEKGVTGELADTGEISRVQCWYAGGGDEIGVFTENGTNVVKAGELGEGEDGGAPFRGNFKTVITL